MTGAYFFMLQRSMQGHHVPQPPAHTAPGLLVHSVAGNSTSGPTGPSSHFYAWTRYGLGTCLASTSITRTGGLEVVSLTLIPAPLPKLQLALGLPYFTSIVTSCLSFLLTSGFSTRCEHCLNSLYTACCQIPVTDLFL